MAQRKSFVKNTDEDKLIKPPIEELTDDVMSYNELIKKFLNSSLDETMYSSHAICDTTKKNFHKSAPKFTIDHSHETVPRVYSLQMNGVHFFIFGCMDSNSNLVKLGDNLYPSGIQKTHGKRYYSSSTGLFQQKSAQLNNELQDMNIDELITKVNQPD